MKKIFIMLTAAAAMTLASCGGNTATNAEKAADEMTNKLTEMVNSANAEEVAKLQEEAKAEIEKLYAEGDTAAAEAYKSKIKQFIDENKAKLEEMSVTDIVSNLGDADKAAEALAEDAEAAVKADAEAAVDSAKTLAAEKANEAVDKAAEKTAEKVNDAVNNAKDELKNKLGLGK